MARFSLRLLFAGIIATALAITAILNANPWWTIGVGCVLGMAVGIAAIVGLIRGRAAPFAIGFATAAICYQFVAPDVSFLPVLEANDLFGESPPPEGQIVEFCITFAWAVLGGLIATAVDDKRSLRAVAFGVGVVLLLSLVVGATAWVKLTRTIDSIRNDSLRGGFQGLNH